MGSRRVLALLALEIFASSCGGHWDVDALEARHPSLAAHGAHRLGAATPYLLPLDGTLTLFLCRWEPDAALRVALPGDATVRERALLERALSAWEEALPGIAFEQVSALGDAQIALAFGAPAATRTAETGADCAVDLDAVQQTGVLSARLLAAHVRLRRSERDARGREMALTDEQLLGSALHELGHALGFQGHAQRGRTVMRYSVDEVRRAARRLLDGEPFRDASVAALYRVPSGSVVGRRALPDGRTEAVDRLRDAAAALRLMGPLVRVGDEAARITWRDAAGRAYDFYVPKLRDVLRDAAELTLEPGASSAELLETTRAP
ncbi:MAG TPA: matrixin family metalloprotease [Myxococcota bacterium]